ncbi:sugar ABC transporter ATP-binding protein [Labrenzia sp. DG1229]|uniref:sugar ABC transporter ATP-binding protein n=1 Tax=Labrenzia sp. DG1229 TaxID=681847 RepID=UPI00056726FF|nr:sugar ABC transporter ATP-binding protein [Labrenzia sp. DG1229]
MEEPPAIHARDISKQFGATQALDSVSLEIARGSVHALVGENGAGKSTFLGILSGRLSLSVGGIEVFGSSFISGEPRSAHRAGVFAIYQELTIVPAMSACENVFLGQQLSYMGLLSRRKMRKRFKRLCARLKIHIDPDIRADTLSIAKQQTLEIMRALEADARLLLFDEPTAALTPAERVAFYEVLQDLRASGVTIVFVSHNLDEVLALSDNVTVFRDGMVVETNPSKAWTKKSLVAAMLGRSSPVAKDVAKTWPVASMDTSLMRVSRLSVQGRVTNVSFDLRAGEIVGIAGLVGSGRTEVLRALSGAPVGVATGQIEIEDGGTRSLPRTPREALACGIALLPENRKAEGLLPALTGAENIVASDYRKASRGGAFLSRGSVNRAAKVASTPLEIREDFLARNARYLSGGNQQKLMLARWIHHLPRIFLCDEPTRGIDVGAKRHVLKHLKSLAAKGIGVILVSSELEEIAEISDRVLVLSDGYLAATLDRTEGIITVNRMLEAAFGANEIK